MSTIFKRMWKLFRKIWSSDHTLSSEIDGHKWESKIEIFSHLSSRHR